MGHDRNPNPNARVRAFFLVADGKYVLGAVSGVDRKDGRTISEVFRAEGYRIATHGLISNSVRA